MERLNGVVLRGEPRPGAAALQTRITDLDDRDVPAWKWPVR
jgi:hypothetical protein